MYNSTKKLSKKDKQIKRRLEKNIITFKVYIQQRQKLKV